LEEFIHAIRKSTIGDFKLPLASLTTKIATAELEPITDTYVQSDEGERRSQHLKMKSHTYKTAADMGMTYDELSRFGVSQPTVTR
jgi:hypothetical protein